MSIIKPLYTNILTSFTIAQVKVVRVSQLSRVTLSCSEITLFLIVKLQRFPLFTELRKGMSKC